MTNDDNPKSYRVNPSLKRDSLFPLSRTDLHYSLCDIELQQVHYITTIP